MLTLRLPATSACAHTVTRSAAGGSGSSTEASTGPAPSPTIASDSASTCAGASASDVSRNCTCTVVPGGGRSPVAGSTRTSTRTGGAYSGDHAQRARRDGEPRLELIAEVVAVDLDRDRPPVAGAHHRLLEAAERCDRIVLGDPRRS